MMSRFLLAITVCHGLGPVYAFPARSAEPEFTIVSAKGWVKTTHVISMSKAAAESLREAVDRVDPKLIGAALARAAPHPALKILTAW